MRKDDEDKVTCRTVNPKATGSVRVPRWKYGCISTAIRDAVEVAGPDGLRFKDINDAVTARLTSKQLAELGSVGWHATTVKLDMERLGQLKRVEGVKPQRIILAKDADGA